MDSKHKRANLRKYKKAMSDLGYYDWDDVKEKLDTHEADKFIDLLTTFAKATVELDESFQAWMGISRTTHPIQKERWEAEEAANNVYLNKRRDHERANTAMQIALLGKDVVTELKRLREEKEEAFERALQEELGLQEELDCH